MTTEEGRFTIAHLDPAAYTLAVSKGGYPPSEYGQTRPADPARRSCCRPTSVSR